MCACVRACVCACVCAFVRVRIYNACMIIILYGGHVGLRLFKLLLGKCSYAR